jgi:dihydropteroate synthase
MEQVRSSPFTFGSVTYDLSSRTFIMGILNITPDSFSDGGEYWEPDAAVAHAMKMAKDGADFIDIGGESTRPGSAPLSAEEEIRRVVPVIEKLSNECDIPISIDTYKSEVAEAALDAGATIVNDITGLHHDERLPLIIAKYSASVVLMHIKGTPKTMQVNPQYDNVVEEIISYLRKSISFAQNAGVDQIILDPGIGFGKTLEHNLVIIQQLKQFQQLGCPVMVGPSRKSFIGTILDLPVEQRLEGTAAVVAASIMNGANIVRVHDVKEMKRVAMVTDRIIRGS